jgi:histone-lysine N-methyltransferase SETMAR
MLQEAFGDNAMSQSETFLWYKRFKDGRTSVDDDQRSGRPSTSTTPENIVKVREAILADRRQIIQNVCEIVGLSHGTVQRILTDNLNMRPISARFVPRLLSDDQQAHRVSLCRELKQQARDDPNFISNIITGNETWLCGYDPETKHQSSQWNSPNSPRPKKNASSLQQCQVHVDRFLRHPRHCPQGIHTSGSNRQWQVLL